MRRRFGRVAVQARIAMVAMWAAYVLVLAGVTTAALSLVNFASGDGTVAAAIAGTTVLLFAVAVALYCVDKRLLHDPVLAHDIARSRRVAYLKAHPRTHPGA
ncbi:hypothetical protein ACXVUM_16520 [Williamsia sp. SKLECPSW1]